MIEPMEIKLKTLTPLWTGGVGGKVDRIHETGIIGSLRWWYEALVRGLGGQACDPSEHGCSFDEEKHRKSVATDERQRLRDAGLCDVCQVFGATGWRRRFRITVIDHETSVANIRHPIRANRSYVDRSGKKKTPTWYFPDPTSNLKPTPPNTPREGNLSIRIQSLDRKAGPEVFGGLIQFVADWAAIGARAQMGFGVVKLEGDQRISMHPLLDWLRSLASSSNHPTLPSLQNIFLAQISPRNGGGFSEQDVFNLKYDLRRLFANDNHVRHFVMGTVRGERRAAKVKMSRPYGNNQMRVWGWIPEQADVWASKWDREKVVSAIHQYLNANYKIETWREINSSRDTVMPNCTDVQVLLQSLLSVEEEDDAA